MTDVESVFCGLVVVVVQGREIRGFINTPNGRRRWAGLGGAGSLFFFPYHHSTSCLHTPKSNAINARFRYSSTALESALTKIHRTLSDEDASSGLERRLYFVI